MCTNWYELQFIVITNLFEKYFRQIKDIEHFKQPSSSIITTINHFNRAHRAAPAQWCALCRCTLLSSGIRPELFPQSVHQLHPHSLPSLEDGGIDDKTGNYWSNQPERKKPTLHSEYIHIAPPGLADPTISLASLPAGLTHFRIWGASAPHHLMGWISNRVCWGFVDVRRNCLDRERWKKKILNQKQSQIDHETIPLGNLISWRCTIQMSIDRLLLDRFQFTVELFTNW